MTKRGGNFNDIYTKKFKVDDNEDLWGEDIDIADIEDCFLLASQVCEEKSTACTQRNNVSILPTYNAFRQNDLLLFTSTQADLNASLNLPTTSGFKLPMTNGFNEKVSKHNNLKRNNDENQKARHNVQALQEQFQAKDGEVSILRSQLKQIKENTQSEQVKKQQEWTEKLNATQKEMNQVKSELEFKNLEITNLKAKVTELSKLYSVELTASENLKVKYGVKDELVKSTVKETATLNVEPVYNTMYPLSTGIASDVFNKSMPENYKMRTQLTELCKNNQFVTKNDDVVEQLKNMVARNCRIDCIYFDISALMKCTAPEINLEKSYTNINNIVVVSKFVIETFYNYLLILESYMQNENIGQLDNAYLENKFESGDASISIFDSREMCENELAVTPRQTVAVISEIFLHSDYLQNHLIENKPLVFENDDLLKYRSSCRHDYLNLILSVITVIGKIRKSDNCVGFLSAVCTLLTNICTAKKLDSCFSMVLEITKEIVFARPSKQIMGYLSGFLKVASVNRKFSQELCKMHKSSKIKTNEGISYFNKDSCLLQVFTLICRDIYVNKLNIPSLKDNLNVLQFIKTLYNSNAIWLHYQENNHCDCLCNVNVLCIEMIYECIKAYRELNKKFDKSRACNAKCKEMLKLSVHLLHVSNFNAFELITKYESVYSQYKCIVKTLLDLSDDLELEVSDLDALKNLCINEELPSIKNKIFENISLWKLS